MARTFNGTSDRIAASIGACGFPLGPSTMAWIARKNADNNFNYEVPLSIGDQDASAWFIWCNLGGGTQLAVWNSSVDTIAPFTWSSSEGWCLIAATKASGNTVIRFHKYVFSTNTWTHQDSSTSAANSATPANHITFGAEEVNGTPPYSGWFDGDIAVGAVWNVVLTDAQIESLAFGLMPWLQLAPKGLWLLDQSAVGQKVVDLSGGGANEISIAGTSVATRSVPVFNYGQGVWVPTIVTPATGGTPQALAATIAGQSSVSAALTVQKALAALIAGQSSVAGALTDQKALAALIAGQSSVSGGLTDNKALAAAVAALSSLSGSLSDGKPLTATIAGQSSMIGQLAGAVTLAATIAGQSSVAAALLVAKAMQAAINAGSTVAAVMRVYHTLAAQIDGVSVVTVSATDQKALAAAIAGQSAVGASLTAGTGTIVVASPDGQNARIYIITTQ